MNGIAIVVQNNRGMCNMGEHKFGDQYIEKAYNDACEYISNLRDFNKSRLTDEECTLLFNIDRELTQYKERLIELDKIKQ